MVAGPSRSLKSRRVRAAACGVAASPLDRWGAAAAHLLASGRPRTRSGPRRGARQRPVPGHWSAFRKTLVFHVEPLTSWPTGRFDRVARAWHIVRCAIVRLPPSERGPVARTTPPATERPLLKPNRSVLHQRQPERPACAPEGRVKGSLLRAWQATCVGASSTVERPSRSCLQPRGSPPCSSPDSEPDDRIAAHIEGIRGRLPHSS